MSTGRSRTGRYHMPAWQKRQPAVQPRITSTTARSCTASITGTTGRVTGGVLEKAVNTWRRAGPSLSPGAHTPGTAARASRRAARDGGSRAATISGSRCSTSPTKNASKYGASGHGSATAGPPPNSRGCSLPAIRGAKRHAGQVQHLEHVGVGELVRQREAPQVAGRHRRHALEGPQRARRPRA